MIEINLLPWRAIARAENVKKRKFFLICFAALLMLWLMTHVGLSLIMKTYDTSIADLQNQLTELTSQTEQNHFNPSLLIVEQIHSSQLELIHFFRTIKQEMWEIVAWSEIASQNNHIIMTGSVDSLSTLAQFVNTYNAKNKLLPMTILSVKNDDTPAIQFRLQLVRTTLPFLSQVKNDDVS